MPLRIRCPHCREIQLVPNEAAGWERACVACGKLLTVPLPAQAAAVAAPPASVASACPRCRAEVAPGTEVCRRCCTVLATGRRLPLRQRLARMSLRARVLVFLTLVVLAAGGIGGYQFYRQSTLLDPLIPPPPALAAAATDGSAVDALLGATDAAAREPALRAVRQAGRPALAHLARRIEDDAAGIDDHTLSAAVALLAAAPDAAWIPALREASARSGCAEEAILARAALGDATVVDAAQALWLQRLRTHVLQKRVAELCADDSPARREILRRRLSELNRATVALQKLRAADDTGPLRSLAPRFWESWTWLGQPRGESFADALFELAKPAPAPGVDFREQIRRARVAIERAADGADATAVAALVLVLTQTAPQYDEAKTRLLRRLAAQLPGGEPTEQQRIAWAVSRLTRLRLGELYGEGHPRDAGFSAIEAVAAWCVRSGLAAACNVEPQPLPTRPAFEIRVASVAGQIERELAAQIESGWSAVDAALERWHVAGLGASQRVREWANPGQRSPNPPALVAGIILLCDHPDDQTRKVFELWRDATDLPPWVSPLARLALAALDVRGGRSAAGWTAALRPEFVEDAPDAPPLALWARLLAAGGPRMVDQLREARDCPLSASARLRLVERAADLARRPR